MFTSQLKRRLVYKIVKIEYTLDSHIHWCIEHDECPVYPSSVQLLLFVVEMNRLPLFRQNQLFLLCICVLLGIVSTEDVDLPNESKDIKELSSKEEKQCNSESCQDLQLRVNSLEEAVRAIVSALSNQRRSSLLSTIGKEIELNSAVRSIIVSSTNTSMSDKIEFQDSSLSPPTKNASTRSSSKTSSKTASTKSKSRRQELETSKSAPFNNDSGSLSIFIHFQENISSILTS